LHTLLQVGKPCVLRDRVDLRFHVFSIFLGTVSVKRRAFPRIDTPQFSNPDKVMLKNRTASIALIGAISLSACTRAAPQPSATLPPFTPAASIQDVMTAIVDPSADALWESVSTETSARGTEEKRPRTDAEWLAVRHNAVALQEAGNLLMIEGRAVTHGGKTTEDAHVAGISSPQQVQQAIDASRTRFNASARELQDAAGEALAAIDARNPARLLAAGGKLDQACERCHSVYWYPNAKQPPAKWPAPLKAN